MDSKKPPFFCGHSNPQVDILDEEAYEKDSELSMK